MMPTSSPFRIPLLNSFTPFLYLPSLFLSRTEMLIPKPVGHVDLEHPGLDQNRPGVLTRTKYQNRGWGWGDSRRLTCREVEVPEALISGRDNGPKSEDGRGSKGSGGRGRRRARSP